MRRIHRWAGVTVALFLFVVAVSGVILQVQKLAGDEGEREEQSVRGSVSTSTANDAFAAMLSRSLDAVRAAAPNEPIVSVELRLAGDTTQVLVTMPGEPGRRITVNAQSGKVTSDEAYERESIFLRIHSGEILGEPGVVIGLLWGLGLVILSATGIIVYLNMYAKRRAVRGKGRVFWVLGFLSAASIFREDPARAGAPFLTDDPGFVAQGWEVRPQASFEDNVNGTIETGALDLNYTIVPTFKLNLTLAEKRIEPVGGASESGFADTDFKFKWRFLEEDSSGWQPAMSIAPNVTFPTAGRRDGLGDGVWRYKVPVQIGKTFGDYYTFGEFGYQWAASTIASDQLIYGLAAQRALTPSLTIGIELNGSAPSDSLRDYGLVANFGAAYVIDDHVQLLGSIGRTVRDRDRGGPETLAQIFLQFNFGS
ncbi:MAG: PepSY domain-containing protein [Alphaproteobacteria bacterium]|nr:PepSY domain-containing protein [Alphaproteobacteria bacterium]